MKIFHCRSDEANCRLVVPQVGYNKFLVPTTDLQQRLRVNMSIDYQRILYIDEEVHFLRVTLTLTKTWYNEHLTYQNLKQGADNQVFQDDKAAWSTLIGLGMSRLGSHWSRAQ